MNKKTNKYIYAYCRMSGKNQTDDQGFDRQMVSIDEFCKKSRFKIKKVYREKVSGTKTETERLEFSRMITDILSNEINTIVIESLERMAGRFHIQDQIIIYLASKGINLISANTGENITEAISVDPMKKALIQMHGIFAGIDKSLLLKKLQKARDEVRKEKGKCEGSKPYGYTAEEAKILHRIRYMRRRSRGQMKRTTYREIADKLNLEGIPTRRGKRWAPALVYNVFKKNLKNPIERV